jgi:riboflavin synthase
LPALGLLTGHLVHGHPDSITRLRARHDHPDGPTLTVEVPPPLTRYLVPGGWISLDGVSLTTAGLADGALTTRPAPGLHATTLERAQPGALLNLELDRLVQHLERLLTATQHDSTTHHCGTPWPSR